MVAANHDLSSMTTPTLMSHFLKATEMSLMLPNLVKLAAIGLPIVDCERGFSTLSRVKTDLRNRLNNTTSIHLLMISVEGPPHSDFMLVIFELAKEIKKYQFKYKHYNNLLAN